MPAFTKAARAAHPRIAVAPVAGNGCWGGQINDRLQRAGDPGGLVPLGFQRHAPLHQRLLFGADRLRLFASGIIAIAAALHRLVVISRWGGERADPFSRACGFRGRVSRRLRTGWW